MGVVLDIADRVQITDKITVRDSKRTGFLERKVDTIDQQVAWSCQIDIVIKGNLYGDKANTSLIHKIIIM